MGARKKIAAEKRKEALKTMYFANSEAYLLLRVKCVMSLT